MPVGVLRGHLASLFVVEGLATLIRLAMDLDVVECAIGLGELVRVSGVPIHVSVGVGGAAIREEVHNLVSGLLMGRQIVPEHCGVLEIGLRVTFLSMDKDGEL